MSNDAINVETGGLTEFADDVKFYAQEIDPVDVDRTHQSFSAGVTFGNQNASVVVLAAKESYAQALTNSLANLNRFVEAAGALAVLAEQAAEDFRAVDGRSARSLSAIDDLLAAAQSQSRPAGDRDAKPVVL